MSGSALIVDPARARALRWWTPARLQSVAQRLHHAMLPWAHSWGLDIDAIDACDAAQAACDPRAYEAALPVPGHTARLWFEHGTPAGQLHAVLFAVAPAAVQTEVTLADETAAEAWRELTNCLARAMPDVPAESEQPVHRWSGALQLGVDIAGAGLSVRMYLRMPAALAASWAAPLPVAPRPSTTERMPLRPVSEVLAERPLRLAVHLSPVVLDLGSLQSLQVGDVIALPHHLDQPLDVGIDLDGAQPLRPLCQGHLAKRAGQLVVELCGPTTH